MNSKLVVYLDVDGTILYEPRDGTEREDLDFQLVCDGLEELLDFVLAHCKPYWLSYRAHLGRTAALAERLFPHLPACARIRPALTRQGWGASRGIKGGSAPLARSYRGPDNVAGPISGLLNPALPVVSAVPAL